MSKPDADYRHFFCMSCGAKLKAKASKAGKELPCPECDTVLVVPGAPASPPDSGADTAVNTSADTYGIRAAEDELRPTIAPHEHSGPLGSVSGKASIPDNASESYAISDMSAGHGSDADAAGSDAEEGRRTHRGLIREPSVRPTPPRWPLLQGVLSFLLEPGAIVYWSALSFMATLCVSLLAAAIGLGNIYWGPAWFISLMSHGITGVVGMLFIIVNAACCLAILQESAAGNRAIEDWPGLAFIEYLLETFFIVNSVLVSAAAAWFLTSPLWASDIARAIAQIVCFVALFPIVLLSMLEAESCLVPVSSAVYQSLRRSMRTWLLFYIESLVIAFGLLMYLVLLVFLLDRYSAHVTIPIVFLTVAMGVGPAVLLEMIYFRLLGRLAWVCDEDSRKELAAEEAAEEEDLSNAEATEIRPVPVDDF